MVIHVNKKVTIQYIKLQLLYGNAKIFQLRGYGTKNAWGAGVLDLPAPRIDLGSYLAQELRIAV